ncbi:MAG TPA: CDGSH iron-sulfur domain-containing protein [Stellaceae bacterium]|nr:CDGSH iron-sulfur domain-containing protein [Stellaceae bacterium]
MTQAVPAQVGPYGFTVEAGKKYFWCACGRSKTQPFCDGAHAGTGFSPVLYTAPKTEEVWFCGCKVSASQPFCDGSHNDL